MSPIASRKSSTARVTRTARIELRLSQEDKNLVTQAAELHGLKPSEYVLRILRRASKRTVEQVRVLDYSRRDQIALVEALLSPPAPNARLRKAKEKYDSTLARR